MRILGIDPGTRVAGYGIVEVRGRQLVGVAAGVWRLGEKLALAERLASLAVEFRRLVSAHSPTHVCIELAFLAKNPRSALFLGHARGVILSESSQAGLLISEVSATSAKKSLTSYGRADKEDVARAIGQILKIDVSDLPLDATDALCIAYGLAAQVQTTALLGNSVSNEVLDAWKSSERGRSKAKKGFSSFVK